MPGHLCVLRVTRHFSSETKFNSGTGWPGFFAAIENATATTVDESLFMNS